MASKVNLNKDVFTTFEVAKICNANITSIKNWIEGSKIRAFRTPGGHYRVERAVLIDFLNRYGMPNPFTARERKRVLLVCKDPATVELVRRSQGRENEVEGTDDPVEAALLVGYHRPDLLVIDTAMEEGWNGAHLIKFIRSLPGIKGMRIIAYNKKNDTAMEHDPTSANHFVRQSDGIEKLNDTIKLALI